MTSIDNHWTGPFKKMMLERSLQGVKCFRDVRLNEQLDQAKGERSITYDNYLFLVQNVAGINDARENEFKMRRFPQRTVKKMERHYAPSPQTFEEFELQEEESEYGCEIDEEEENNAFETYLTERRVTTKKPFLSNELWQRLSREDKQVWGKLSSGGKLIILHGNCLLYTSPSPRD